MKIKKPTLNFIIDFNCIRILCVPGSQRHPDAVYPSTRVRTYLTIWSLSRHDWGTIHFWIAIFLLATLSLHIIFHWDWIVCRLKGRNCDDKTTRIRVLIGIFALMALIALALAPIFSPVEKTSPGFHRRTSKYTHSWNKLLRFKSQ